ncbi:MAG: phosphate acyltransferase [Humidesulfovibrio sp.]|uniref:phosphate acyltransferase n=1 Tax=Humidesulfovibrio sp. TaxID=2910988 RepID=UPI002736BB41|nr:phosphate acyltransferase [Humidesulfovibrio sp.]MDP2848263.1 phosphate acyltransferase [Humidesulfovibrio sp.]
MKCLDDIIRAVQAHGSTMRVAIAPCAERFVLRAALAAAEAGLASPVFIGDRGRACAAAETLCPNFADFEFVDCPDDNEAVALAVDYYRQGKVQFIMKGLVSTATLLKAALAKGAGLVSPGGIVSLVSVFDAPNQHDSPRLMLLTDAGVNIRPNLQRKMDIIKNALGVARALGIRQPRVAVLAATEKVNFPAMPATLDADLLSKMAADGTFGDALVAGPLALDLAVSPASAKLKGIDNPVAGHADILLTPDIESGNILHKALSTLLNIPLASVVVGSKAPVVVPSRGDSERSKFVSIALAVYLAQQNGSPA